MQEGEEVYCEFQGHSLHSNNISMDLAYQEIFGCTKKEYIKNEENKLQEEKRKQYNIQKWLEEGQTLIFPERYENWKSCVIYGADHYRETIINATLELIKELEKGTSLEDAKQLFEKQEHSGISKLFVRNLVLNFSSRGPEFWEATAWGEIPLKTRQFLEAQKQENIQLLQAQTAKKKILEKNKNK